MEKVARIIGKSDKAVIAEVLRNGMCGDNCKNCSGCSDKVNIPIECDFDVPIGKLVVIELRNSKILKAALLVYIFPLLIMFLSYFISFKIFYNDLISGIISFISLFLSFGFIKFIGGNFLKNYKSRIIKILD